MRKDSDAHKLLVIGGGVAGIEIASTIARKYRREQIHVTLVDRDSAHIWKPMLHTIAAGTRNISQQQTSFVTQACEAGFAYLLGELESIQCAAKEVSLSTVYSEDGRALIPARNIPYDTLVLAIGSEANDFGTSGVATHCYRIDSRTQADDFNKEIRIRMLLSQAQELPLSIAIVGGGATGVELAAELVRLTELAEGYGAKGLADRISITLIESGSRLLAAFPEDISESTRQRLERIGVEVLLGARVSEAREDGLVLADGRTIAASLKVWAAGVKAPEILRSLEDLEINDRGQLVIRPTLQTTLDDRIFSVGDCASLTLPECDRPLSPTAQVAHQQARHLAEHLPQQMLNGRAIPDFVYRDFGSLVSLSDYDAYGSLGQFGFFKGTTIRGRLAQFSHAMLYRRHQTRLHGFWRGGLLWLVDRLNATARASIRLD